MEHFKISTPQPIKKCGRNDPITDFLISNISQSINWGKDYKFGTVIGIKEL